MTQAYDPARTPRLPARAKPRKGMDDVTLSREVFGERFRERFYYPAYQQVGAALRALEEKAYEAYEAYRKSPRLRRAGRGFAVPEAKLSEEWLATRAAIRTAQARHDKRRTRSRVLVINGSPRSDQSCPGEMSKSFRLAQRAVKLVERTKGFEADLLDLSRLTSEMGRTIYPCKACVSTAMPLCNWPCSCYPNHALGQTGDWMAEIYPRWVAAHGVLIVTPVNWYQAPSVLKLMIDRLVCADGGNPDPTLTGGKDPVRAKALELAGWHYPKHLAGRAFAVAVHGDAAGVEGLTSNLTAWLSDMGLIQAGPLASLGRYVGYYGAYATSHADLDEDTAFQREVDNAVLSLVALVKTLRAGDYLAPDRGLEEPRPK